MCHNSCICIAMKPKQFCLHHSTSLEFHTEKSSTLPTILCHSIFTILSIHPITHCKLSTSTSSKAYHPPSARSSPGSISTTSICEQHLLSFQDSTENKPRSTSAKMSTIDTTSSLPVADQTHHLSGGAIAGIVVVSVMGASLLCLLCWLLVRSILSVWSDEPMHREDDRTC